jgi:hypothetical protein
MHVMAARDARGLRRLAPEYLMSPRTIERQSGLLTGRGSGSWSQQGASAMTFVHMQHGVTAGSVLGPLLIASPGDAQTSKA